MPSALPRPGDAAKSEPRPLDGSAKAPHGSRVKSPSPPRLLLGILFMLMAGSLFPVMGGFAKLLGQEYSSLQISWARAFGHIVFLSALFLPRYGLAIVRTKRLGLQLFRSCMLFTSNACYFFGIGFIPLGKAAAISLAAPLAVALLAWPMLGERTTPARVVALVCGFIGVLIVIRPGTALFHWASLFIVASGTAYGIYQILTRRIAGIDPPETSALLSAVVGAFGMLLVLPFVWQTPDSWVDLGLFLGVGVIGALGHYCVAHAFGYAPANVLSPFQYFQLLGSVFIGWLMFSEFPDATTWLGAAVIVGSGIFIGWSSRRAVKTVAGP